METIINVLVRWLTVAAVASPLFLQAACSAGAQSNALAQETQSAGRVIVKLHQPVANEAALMKLIHEKLPQPERIAFFRAISNDAYVLNLIAPATKKDLPQIMEQLTATGLFEYVEEDKLMSIRGPAK